MWKLKSLSVVLLCASIVGNVGCRSKQPAAIPKADTKATDGPLLAPPQQPTPQADHAALPADGDAKDKSQTSDAEKPSADATADAAKIKANLALLSTEDRALAEKQKICPVSGEALGGMGAPKKISVAGREVFICCPGCEKSLTSEPDKYLAKIGLQPAK